MSTKTAEISALVQKLKNGEITKAELFSQLNQIKQKDNDVAPVVSSATDESQKWCASSTSPPVPQTIPSSPNPFDAYKLCI